MERSDISSKYSEFRMALAVAIHEGRAVVERGNGTCIYCLRNNAVIYSAKLPTGEVASFHSVCTAIDFSSSMSGIKTLCEALDVWDNRVSPS